MHLWRTIIITDLMRLWAISALSNMPLKTSIMGFLRHKTQRISMDWSATVRTWYGAPKIQRTFSVVQQYPWRVAPQHCPIPFPDEHAKTIPVLLYLQTVLKRGRLREKENQFISPFKILRLHHVAFAGWIQPLQLTFARQQPNPVHYLHSKKGE